MNSPSRISSEILRNTRVSPKLLETRSMTTLDIRATHRGDAQVSRDPHINHRLGRADAVAASACISDSRGCAAQWAEDHVGFRGKLS